MPQSTSSHPQEWGLWTLCLLIYVFMWLTITRSQSILHQPITENLVAFQHLEASFNTALLCNKVLLIQCWKHVKFAQAFCWRRKKRACIDMLMAAWLCPPKDPRSEKRGSVPCLQNETVFTCWLSSPSAALLLGMMPLVYWQKHSFVQLWFYKIGKKETCFHTLSFLKWLFL